MLGKLDEYGNLKTPPKTNTVDGVAISNYHLLPESGLLEHGWKHVIEIPQPEMRDGYGASSYYVDDGVAIMKVWELYELPKADDWQLP